MRRARPTAETPVSAWLIPAGSRSNVAHWWPVTGVVRIAACGHGLAFKGRILLSPGVLAFVKCKKCDGAMK